MKLTAPKNLNRSLLFWGTLLCTGVAVVACARLAAQEGQTSKKLIPTVTLQQDKIEALPLETPKVFLGKDAKSPAKKTVNPSVRLGTVVPLEKPPKTKSLDVRSRIQSLLPPSSATNRLASGQDSLADIALPSFDNSVGPQNETGKDSDSYSGEPQPLNPSNESDELRDISSLEFESTNDDLLDTSSQSSDFGGNENGGTTAGEVLPNQISDSASLLGEADGASENMRPLEPTYSAEDFAKAKEALESLPPPGEPERVGLPNEGMSQLAIPNEIVAPEPRNSNREGNSAASKTAPSATTNSTNSTNSKKLKAPKYNGKPEYFTSFGEMKGPHTDTLVRQVPFEADAFCPTPPVGSALDPFLESSIYRGKYSVPVQRPLVELWRPFYTSGPYQRGKNWFGRYNLVMPHFLVYGDFRTGVGINQNVNGDNNNLAFRANIDMDLEITATERIHAFITPLDRAGDYTQLNFTDSATFVDRTDLRLDTLFFEGDAGAIWGGITDQDAPFDLPFTFGFLPFFYQNGIWANDNAIGAAFALPARHSRRLNWSNFDATFFWATDQINSDAFPGDNNAAEFFGTAWFIDAYDGYIEWDYAFVHDDTGQHRSYHNFSVSFTRRYFNTINNSIRFLTNFDQALPRNQRTAQGHLLLIENSLMTFQPNTFVPYLNMFYGQGRTQSLARAGAAGGILNNTGINFETDGLNGYPTLDATAVNTAGAALGVNLLGANFEHQLILEVAGLRALGSQQFRNAPGDQYAAGMRYQRPINHAWIFRTDHMLGFLRNSPDIRGHRVELRWKF